MQFVDEKNLVVAVVDPNHERHPVLERVCAMVEQVAESESFEVVVLIVADANAQEGGRQLSLVRDETWVTESIKKPLDSVGANFSVKYCWLAKSTQNLLDICEQEAATILGIPYHDKDADSPLSEENWKLLRSSKIPVLIAHHDRVEASGAVLSTVKFQDDSYVEPNDKVLLAGMQLSALFDVPHYIANAYNESLEFPDRSKISSQANVPSDQIHITMGKPEDVICDVAATVNADLVLIANQRRKGLSARIRGNTVEKILRRVKRDVLMI